MKTRRKRSSVEPSALADQQAGDPTVILVRRGALRRFDNLKRKTAELPVVVAWDRRVEERRTAQSGPSTDRRARDRRTSQPFTWDLADFVVVPGTAQAPATATARPERSGRPAPARTRPAGRIRSGKPARAKR